ncbi:phage tail protein [bacterium]|nr:phage tail protein [bacterium]
MADPFLGEVRLFGGTFAPVGWAFCNGQLLSIAQNDALFSLLGTTYGGDGVTTFGLPNLQGRLPLHQGTLQGGGTYALGQLAGSETVTLVGGQIGPHTHSAGAGGGASTGTPTNNLLGATGPARYLRPGSGPILALNVQTVQSAGGGQPHANMMPYLCVSFIIALNGLYPSQG